MYCYDHNRTHVKKRKKSNKPGTNYNQKKEKKYNNNGKKLNNIDFFPYILTNILNVSLPRVTDTNSCVSVYECISYKIVAVFFLFLPVRNSKSFKN